MKFINRFFDDMLTMLLVFVGLIVLFISLIEDLFTIRKSDD